MSTRRHSSGRISLGVRHPVMNANSIYGMYVRKKLRSRDISGNRDLAARSIMAFMSQQVEVNMKIPSFIVRSSEQPDKKIDNSAVRFHRRVLVEAIPKPGDRIPLSTRLGEPFDCTVTRTEWSEEKNMFVVSCTYSRRSITADEYTAVITDPDWVSKQLS